MNWEDILKGPNWRREKAMKRVKGKIDYLLNLNLKRNVELSKEEADKLETFLQKELDGFLPNAEIEVELHLRDKKYNVGVRVTGMGEPMNAYYTHEIFSKKIRY